MQRALPSIPLLLALASLAPASVVVGAFGCDGPEPTPDAGADGGSDAGADAGPPLSPSCFCEDPPASCEACFPGARLVALAHLHVDPADAERLSEQWVSVSAPAESEALVMWVRPPAGADPAAIRFELEVEGTPGTRAVELAQGAAIPLLPPGWARVRAAEAPGPFELTVLAAAPASAPAFAEASWMGDRGAAIEDRPLNELCLPGTHDAATSGLNPESPWGNGAPLPGADPRIAIRTSRSQDRSLEQQLLAGIRYLDLRVDLDEEGVLRSVHGLRGERYEALLDDLRRFLEGQPEEILILDFQHISGPPGSGGRFEQLAGLVEAAIGPHMVDPALFGPTSTPRELRDAGTTAYVIFGGAPSEVIAAHRIFDRDAALLSPWGNMEEVEPLMGYLEDALRSRPADRFFVTQGVMTPSESTAIFWAASPHIARVEAPCERDAIEIGLCAYARALNPALAEAMIGTWGGLAMNVVMVDYPDTAPIVARCHDRNTR